MSTSVATAPASFERRLFRLGRGANIALAAVIVLALAGAGLLAGVLMKGPLVQLKPSNASRLGSLPSSSGLALHSTSVGVRGTSAATGLRSLPRTFGATLTQTDGSEGFILTAGPLTVPTPPPWQVTGSDDNEAALADGLNDWVYVLVTHQDPTDDAANLIANSLTDLLPADHYTNLQTSEIQTLQPYGAMTSVAVVAYQATWVDQQGSFDLYGNLWIAVRNDGLGVVETAETTPPSDWETHTENWGPVVYGTADNFAGTTSGDGGGGTTLTGSLGDPLVLDFAGGNPVTVTVSSTAVPPDPAPSGDSIFEVFISLENGGTAAFTGDIASGATLIDATGAEHQPVAGPSGVSGPFGGEAVDLFAGVTLDPGATVNGFLTFEVPPDATPGSSASASGTFRLILPGGTNTGEWSV